MEHLSRGKFIASVLGGALGLVSLKSSSAQEQVVGNGTRIVATGNVHVGQNASASQTTRAAGSVTGTGIQVVTNDGSIVATGDVWVEQDAAASQVNRGGGGQAGSCYPGQVAADPGTGQLFYCDYDNCWQEVRCGRCR